MSSEAIETRLDKACLAAYTFHIDDIEDRDGESFKIMTLTFISEVDRDAFKQSMRGG